MSELIEVEESATLRREEAADRLRAIADQLSRHNELAWDQGGLIEITDEGGELEVEISW